MGPRPMPISVLLLLLVRRWPCGEFVCITKGMARPVISSGRATTAGEGACGV